MKRWSRAALALGGTLAACVVGIRLIPRKEWSEAQSKALNMVETAGRAAIEPALPKVPRVLPSASPSQPSRPLQRTVTGTLGPNAAARAMNERWAAERVDEGATGDLTTYIAEALHDLDVDGEIDDLSCKETLCRVRLHFSDAKHAQKFEAEAGMLERRKTLDVTVTEGVIDVEVFLARE